MCICSSQNKHTLTPSFLCSFKVTKGFKSPFICPRVSQPSSILWVCLFLSFLPSFLSRPSLFLFYLQEINPCRFPGGFTEECDRNVYYDIYAIPDGRSRVHYQNEPLRQSKRRDHYDNGWSLLGTQGQADAEFSGSQVHNLF